MDELIDWIKLCYRMDEGDWSAQLRRVDKLRRDEIDRLQVENDRLRQWAEGAKLVIEDLGAKYNGPPELETVKQAKCRHGNDPSCTICEDYWDRQVMEATE